MDRCDSIKCVVLVAAVLIAPGLLAHQGMVETRDGKTFTGQVQFDTNRLIVVNAEQGFRVSIPLADLLGASFKIEPKLAAGIPVGEKQQDQSPLGTLPDRWQSTAISPATTTQAEDSTPGGLLGELCIANLRFSTVLSLVVESVVKYAEASRQEDLAGTFWTQRPQTRFLYGVFQVDSAGTNIAGAADACHFVFKPVTGDSEIMARVLHVPNTAPWAKAGLMMRETLRSDSANVFLAVKPVGGGVLQRREIPGGDTTANETRAIGVPYWLKLKRTGNSFAAYYSRGGRQWRLLQTIEVPLADQIYVGLAVTGVRETQAASGAKNNPSHGVTRRFFKHCSFDQVREAPFLPSWFVPRIELQNGSMVLGRIASADQARIGFEGGILAPDPVPTAAVANILFQWVPSKTQALLEAGRAGVALTGGEFVEGQFRGIEKDRLQMSSVLQGLRNYDVNNEVMALVLRKTLPAFQAYEVQTVDGSVWLGQEIEMRNNELVLQAGSAGRRRFLLYDLRSIRRLNS